LSILLAPTSAVCTSTATIFRGLTKPKVTVRTTGAAHDFSQNSAWSRYFSISGRSILPTTRMK